MGHFSNGSEGMVYNERWCCRCVHWRNLNDGRGDGCPVWDLHLLHNGDESKKSLLDELIPPNGAFNGECRMFVESPAAPARPQPETMEE